MIPYDEALEKILAEVRPTEPQDVLLLDALGRRTASELRASLDSPVFDCSSVDGYAVRSADLKSAPSKPVELKIVGKVFAGDDPAKLACGPGECVRTMTGAPVAGGADAVVMQEDVEATDTVARFSAVAKPGQCVRYQGEEYRQGDLLLPTGTLCTPPVLALFASQGNQTVGVASLPTIAVFVTGEELAGAGDSLKPGQIYDSNSMALASAIKLLTGMEPVTQRIGDDSAKLREAMKPALDVCDLIVFSGGASVGEKDLVREACLAAGVEERFWRVNMKPGKPVFFGVHKKGALVLALPGNPVSSQVTFELLVAPAIRKMTGDPDPKPKRQQATLGACVKRHPGRLEFLRATTKIESGRVIALPLERQGSHMASGIAVADRLIVVPQDRDCLEAGETVDTIPLRWSQL